VTLLLTLLIMAVVAIVAAVAAGRITGGLDRPASSLPGRGLPPGPVTMDDLERVRFSPALRGYRMDEVDDVLDRLADELRRRDEEIAQLRVRAAFGRQPFGERPVHGLDPEPSSDEADSWRRPAPDYPEDYGRDYRPDYSPDHPRSYPRDDPRDYGDPFPPAPGVPAAPPRGGHGGHDEHGGGR
jgi:DivIVA domain-containing protein